MARAGAPRDGDRFVNLAGPRDLPGFTDMLPFFLRKAWTSLVPRAGAARRVPFDRVAMMHNPSVTWIGHSTRARASQRSAGHMRSNGIQSAARGSMSQPAVAMRRRNRSHGR